MDHLTISRKLRSNKVAAEGYVHYDSTYVKLSNTTYIYVNTTYIYEYYIYIYIICYIHHRDDNLWARREKRSRKEARREKREGKKNL